MERRYHQFIDHNCGEIYENDISSNAEDLNNMMGTLIPVWWRTYPVLARDIQNVSYIEHDYGIIICLSATDV